VARTAHNRREHRTRCIIAGETFEQERKQEKREKKNEFFLIFFDFFLVETIRKLAFESISRIDCCRTRLAHARTVINHQCLHFLFHSSFLLFAVKKLDFFAFC